MKTETRFFFSPFLFIRSVSVIISFAGLFSLSNASADVESSTLRAALEAQPSCQNFVRHDNAFLYLGFGPYLRGTESPREPIPGKVEVASLADPTDRRTLETLDGAIDALTFGNRLFVLTYSALEEWNRNDWKRVAVYETYMTSNPKKYREHATGMVLLGDVIVISHGRLGVSLFDVNKSRLRDQKRVLTAQLPLESQVTGIARVETARGQRALLLVDSFSLVPDGRPRPFTGLVVFDVKASRVEREIKGLRPGVEALRVSGDKLVIGVVGSLWRYELSSLNGSTLPEDPNPLRTWPDGGYPFSRFELKDNVLFTCYSQPPTERGRRYRQVPRVLDLP